MKQSDISVYLRCGKKKLTEYQVKEDTGGGKGSWTVTCWIASQINKEFGIYWTNYNRKRALLIHVYMDDQLVDRYGQCTFDMQGKSEGLPQGKNTIRPYCFGEIQTTDDESVAEPGSADHELGMIKVHFWSARVKTPDPEKCFGSLEVKNPRIVHESDEKAGGHHICFGEARQTRKDSSEVEVDPEPEPFVTFIFRYRTEATLCRYDIIPKPSGSEVARKRRRVQTDSPARRSKRLRGEQPEKVDDEQGSEERRDKDPGLDEEAEDQPTVVKDEVADEVASPRTPKETKEEPVEQLEAPMLRPDDDAAPAAQPGNAESQDDRGPTLDYIDIPEPAHAVATRIKLEEMAEDIERLRSELADKERKRQAVLEESQRKREMSPIRVSVGREVIDLS